MRSWNIAPPAAAGAPIPTFAIYQWGVETQNFVPSNLKTHQGSQFTNEELKQIRILNKKSHKCRFAIYQWGVETQNRDVEFVFLPLFAIYQWGVETVAVSFLAQSSYMFAIYQWGVETWYKCNPKLSFLWSSQFTNEELKLSDRNKANGEDNGSQFTNEELKL